MDPLHYLLTAPWANPTGNPAVDFSIGLAIAPGIGFVIVNWKQLRC